MSAVDTGAPTVSVCMITYNHECFVAQAIESVLMQQTGFPIELVIGEDCSTDQTRSIVNDYAQRYPQHIRALLPDSNLGMIPNFVATLQACRGQYVALLEGDDYWTDPHKLQNQVEFLEEHHEYSMCFHDVRIISEDSPCVLESYGPPYRKPFFTLDDIVERCFIQTCSVMLRNGLVREYPSWFYEAPNGDWMLFVLAAQHGDIGYLEMQMASYRLHQGGVWTGHSTLHKLQQILPLYGYFYRHLGPSHGRAVRAGACVVIAGGAAAQYNLGEPGSLSSSLAFIADAVDAAVDAGYSNSSFVRTTWARSYEALGFAAYQKHDLCSARYCFTRSLLISPSMARNTGMLSLLFEAILGKRASALRRTLWSHLRTDRRELHV